MVAALDVVFYILMPSMTKAMRIMHCRYDTPNGIGRMHSVLAIECDGADYNLLRAVAMLTYVVCGFVFPLWLMTRLFMRADSPSAHTDLHTIWVGNIPEDITSPDALAEIFKNKSCLNDAHVSRTISRPEPTKIVSTVLERGKGKKGTWGLVCFALTESVQAVLAAEKKSPTVVGSGPLQVQVKLDVVHFDTSRCGERSFLSRKNKHRWAEVDSKLSTYLEEKEDKHMSVYWATSADGSRSRRDWLSPLYQGVTYRCWWWSAALLLRRTFISTFASRRDGDQMDLMGSSADWRSMVVLILALNILLVHVFHPFSKTNLNNFSSLSILLLVVLYVLKISDEVKFFLFLFVVAAIVIVLTLGLIMVQKFKQQKKVDRSWSMMRTTNVGAVRWKNKTTDDDLAGPNNLMAVAAVASSAAVSETAGKEAPMAQPGLVGEVLLPGTAPGGVPPPVDETMSTDELFRIMKGEDGAAPPANGSPNRDRVDDDEFSTVEMMKVVASGSLMD